MSTDCFLCSHSVVLFVSDGLGAVVDTVVITSSCVGGLRSGVPSTVTGIVDGVVGGGSSRLVSVADFLLLVVGAGATTIVGHGSSLGSLALTVGLELVRLSVLRKAVRLVVGVLVLVATEAAEETTGGCALCLARAHAGSVAVLRARAEALLLAVVAG